MRNRTLLILLALSAFLAAVNCNALTILQNQFDRANQVLSFSPSGQSFLAADSDIGEVGFFIHPMNQHINDLTLSMSIYSGSGDFSESARLGTEEFTLPDRYLGWIDLNVSNIAFTTGNTYTIGISNDTAQWGYYLQDDSNPYSGGTAWIGGTAHQDQDLRFRVNPGTNVAVPDLSSSLLLLCTSLFGLFCVLRKSRRIKESI